jgi:hypothetical protein
MDFGQLRSDRQESARNMMYQNTGYQFERRDKKTLVLDIVDDTSTSTPLAGASEFSVDLFEPLIVDKLSDVYIDSVSTYNSLLCDSNNRSAFSLNINDFNISSNVASTTGGQNIYNKIIIPNENNDVGNINSVVIHKGKKMNYVCSINPGKITKLSGKISGLDGTSMFTTSSISTDARLYHLELTDLVNTDIPSGTNVTFGGSASPIYKTAFHTRVNSKDLYVYLHSGTRREESYFTTSRAVAFAAIPSGITPATKNTLVNSCRISDYPRFTTEFIIEARQ